MNNQFQALSTPNDLPLLRPFLLDLFCQLAYQEGDFVLSSGQRSSYYINGKQVTLHAQGALAIGRLLLSMVPADTQAVAGLTLGADPIVSAVSIVSALENRPILDAVAHGGNPQDRAASLPGLIIRKQPKGHGTRAYIEGPSLPTGAKVVVLEDVVTTGQSAMKAVNRLKEAGYQVELVIALVDRLQGGAELYQSAGLMFKALFSINEIREHYQGSLDHSS